MSGTFLCVPIFVFAYNDKTTHPELTGAIVDLYNSEFSNKIGNRDRLFVVKGSIEEDTFGRWMRHFYDPVYEKGLAYLGNWQSSKGWAQDHKAQAKLDPKMFLLAAAFKPFSGSTDYSWERSVYEYAWGSKERGLEGLGHILHLLEDAAVPDHTRNDAHPTGSVYEGFAMDKRVEGEERGLRGTVVLGSVEEYFNRMAMYSNNNFFSKDTIFIDKYSSPIISEEGYELLSDGQLYRFGYRTIENNKFKLVLTGKRILGSTKEVKSIEDVNHLILSDYWSLLSKQVVLNGAGMVKLFFDEVEKEKKTKKLLAYNRSPAEKMSAAIVGLFYSPTIKQAQSDPEIAEDLGLPAPGAEIVDETYEPNMTNKTNTVTNVAPVPPADSPEGSLPSAPIIPPAPPPQIQSQPQNTTGPQITSPAMPIAGGGGAPPPEPAEPAESPPPSDDTEEDEDPPAPPPPPPPPPSEEDDEPEPPADTEAPNIVYSIAECDSSLVANGCLLLSGGSFNISWSSTSTDLSSYTIECVFSASNCSGFPITDTTSTSTTVDLSQQGIYTLTFKAKDAANNQNSTTTQIEINLLPVVINEVAWMGTDADATDEWIELFNASSFNINLGDGTAASWLLTATDGSPNIFLNGTIPAGGYFVLERTSSETTSYAENQIFTGAINDLFPGGGDDLALKNPAGDTIDSTKLVSEIGTVAGTKLPQRKTAERLNPLFRSLTSESNALNWRAASSTLSSVTDKNGGAILGTPGAQNSIYSATWKPTHIRPTDVISTDTIWTETNSPYVISSSAGQFLTINSGVTLTIDPGVTVMQYVTLPGIGANQMMRVNGKIIAEGADAKNIVFTDLLDSDYGGWGGSTKGDWSRIIFSASSAGNSFKKVKFRHGGWYDWMSESPKPVFDIDLSAGIIFDGAVFEKSYNSVFMLSGAGYSGVSIKNSSFRENGSAPASTSGNIYAENGAAPEILGNNFLDNNIYPITIRSSYSAIGSNSASGNPINGIFVRENASFSSDTAWSGTLPYILESSGGARPTINSGATLTINPGVVLKPQNNATEYLRIDGVLNWNATAENPGIVTSFKDDSYGGDANNDGIVSVPATGDLFNSGIHFTNTTATSTLSNILLRYGNSGNEISQDAGALLEKINVVSGP